MKLLLLAALAVAVIAEDSYVVVAPAKFRPGMDYSVSVNILRANGDVNVKAFIVRSRDRQEYGRNSAILRQGTPKTIDLRMPTNMSSGSYELHVEGTGGLSFVNKTSVDFSAKAMSILVQTDKAMYKPGQTVNFRVLAVYANLSLYSGKMDIEIYDYNSNKIKQWLGVVAGEMGVVTQKLALSTQPVLGDWKIKVTAGNSVEEKAFTIAEYVLPKFEVTVDVPPYVLDSAQSVPVTVKAKYTYGKPVAGSVVVRAEVTARYYLSHRGSVERSGQLDEKGTAVVTFPMDELRKVSPGERLIGNDVKFTADVTETLTGAVLNGTGSIKVYQYGYKLEYPASNPKTFKPGLDYVAYVKVSQPDGRPLGTTSAATTVTITPTVTAEVPHTGTTPFSYYLPRTTSYTLPSLSLSVPSNGLVPFRLSVPTNATSVNLKATVGSVDAFNRVQKSYSPSDNYMQLSLISSGQLRAGGQARFNMKATEKVQTMVYQVLSRGSIVATGTVSAGGATSTTFSLSLQANMAPNARIVLYYVRTDGEIVTDSVSFDVSGVFKNQVTVSLDTKEAQPADEVTVTVTATPRSAAYLLAVDQSVLLLKSGNDITQEQVIEELKSYDTISSTSSPGGIVPLLGRPMARRKRMIWFPYPVYYGGSDASQIFENAGVVVLTDALVYRYVKPFQFPRYASFARAFSAKSSPALKEVERVRSEFPETWLWDCGIICENGSASLTTTVPDSITSWVTSAFAVSPDTGLGVAPTASKLRVFRPFFVSLNLPYSVVRNEQVVLQAIVFNYMDTDQDVVVSLAQSQDFANIVVDANGVESSVHQDTVINVRVPKGEGKSVYFPIEPTKLGNVELVVSARSTQAADAVRRQLLVEAEGVPKEVGISVLVDLSRNRSFSKTVPLSRPSNVVADSSRTRVTVIGDLMGPTINGLDKLLTMPTGCGEQTMIGLAPDVFITSYLSATNQLTGEISQKAINYMEQGYQRELTYQHKDGSFSAFGDRDDSGSMWLTAFVAKTFHQAKPYIFIDDNVIERALTWMVTKQRADGSFPEPGRVIHKNMQGGAGSGTGLTAYVAISLLENKDITGELGQTILKARNNALDYLKRQLPSLTDDYLLAMATYALTLAGDSAAVGALQTLNNHAVDKDGFRYWHKEPAQPTNPSRHTWRNPQAASVDVEMTSYVLMTYATLKNVPGGLNILKWVASQRNPRGGYSSTQDTVLALQALSEFARLVYSKNFDIQLDIQAGTFQKRFSVSQNNALVLQSADLPSNTNSVSVDATGSGIALVEVGLFFNVEAEVEEPFFDLSVTLQKDTLNLLRIQACARWLGEGSSGMAVMELGVPSGFEVDVTSLKSSSVIKRKEIQDRKLNLYFDEVGRSQACTVMIVNRFKMVSKSKPVAVRIYDYYEPEKQATVFYQSAVLKDSSVCDVCAGCDCPGSKVVR